jgi:biopolymer transport protein ExbD
MGTDFGQSSVRGRLDLGPLVDVALVLLILFLVGGSFLHQHSLIMPPVDFGCGLPPSVSTCPLVLRMDRQGHLFFGKEEVAARDFPVRLSAVMQGAGSSTVYIAASGELPYGQVLDFIDLCHRSGARNLAVVYEEL